MPNNEWYIICDMDRNTAIDFLQLPAMWKEKVQLQGLSDEQLATFNEWSGFPNVRFLPIAEARSSNLNNDSIDYAFSVNFTDYAAWVRKLRDLVLAQTDNVMLEDRWSRYDAVAKRNILAYRNALRDLTKTIIYGETWPAIPTELDFLRSTKVPAELLPSRAFLAHLSNAPVPLTKEQIIIDQTLRIEELRDVKRYGGVPLTINDKEYWFWNDEGARNQYAIYSGIEQRMGLAPADVLEEHWKTMSKEFVPVTVATLHNIIDTGAANERACYIAAEGHRQAMIASDDPASYDFTQGWPRTFADAVK